MVIQQYSNEYLSKLVNLMNQWYDDADFSEIAVFNSILYINEKTENKIFIALNENDEVTGYIFTGISCFIGNKPFVEIIALLVDKDNRSKGIGSSLIRHIEKYYKEVGIDEVRLNSRVERDRAHIFYERHGFKEYKQSKFFSKQISK